MEATTIAAPEVQTNLNVVWTLIAGILVFTMQAGFALVETGFTRAKNAANTSGMVHAGADMRKRV